MRVTDASAPATAQTSALTTALTQARRWAGRWVWAPDARGVRVAAVLVGVAALAVYVLPALPGPAAQWPMWDVRVYWWGGQQAAAGGGALYLPNAPLSFTYPPFAALVFAGSAGASVDALKIALTVGSLVALPLLCGQSLAAAGVRLRAETIFLVSALALLTWPVAYTVHLGEVNLILAVLVGADLLRRNDGVWWQGIGTGLAAGIKLTPLIFVVYLALTGRLRAALTATVTFAATVTAGFIWLPERSRTFWLGGVFYNQSRIGNPANPSDQSLSGAIARLAGTGDPPQTWWLVAALAVGLAGLAVAIGAHRRGHRLAGVVCCAITGLLISPISWTHHWVWDIPLLVWLTTAAWRRRSAIYAAGSRAVGSGAVGSRAVAAACALAALAGVAVFSDYTPIPWPGHPPDAWRMLASDLFVLFGLAVLAATGIALALAWRSSALAPNKPVGLDPSRSGEVRGASSVSLTLSFVHQFDERRFLSRRIRLRWRVWYPREYQTLRITRILRANFWRDGPWVTYAS
jgi:alpha-1,2-mannosyltransferase